MKEIIKRLRIKPGRGFKLKKVDPSHSFGTTKDQASARLEKNIERLYKQQYLLYAENKRSLLIILQGMDASGKDGVIRHVMKGMNPQGCTVTPFKSPSHDELEHDYLWRIHKAVPAKGDIGIFNRSQYEDVLIVRVQKLLPREIWKARYEQINQFEKMLAENNVTILKFFLCISKDEQKARLQERLSDPQKNWKFQEGDLKERKFWDDYMDAYQEMIERCSTKWAPWYVIPANKKWFRNLAVSEIINETLSKMNLKLPPASPNLKRIKIS